MSDVQPVEETLGPEQQALPMKNTFLASLGHKVHCIYNDHLNVLLH